MGSRSAQQGLKIRLLPHRLAVCRLKEEEPVPAWALSCAFCSVTRAPGELSLVCLQASIPPAQAAGMQVQRGFKAFQVEGPLDFALTGVLAGLLAPLAKAGIPVFVLSTFLTDYLLVREEAAERAAQALSETAEVLREPD